MQLRLPEWSANSEQLCICEWTAKSWQLSEFALSVWWFNWKWMPIVCGCVCKSDPPIQCNWVSVWVSPCGAHRFCLNVNRNRKMACSAKNLANFDLRWAKLCTFSLSHLSLIMGKFFPAREGPIRSLWSVYMHLRLLGSRWFYGQYTVFKSVIKGGLWSVLLWDCSIYWFGKIQEEMCDGPTIFSKRWRCVRNSKNVWWPNTLSSGPSQR